MPNEVGRSSGRVTRLVDNLTLMVWEAVDLAASTLSLCVGVR